MQWQPWAAAVTPNLCLLRCGPHPQRDQPNGRYGVDGLCAALGSRMLKHHTLMPCRKVRASGPQSQQEAVTHLRFILLGCLSISTTPTTSLCIALATYRSLGIVRPMASAFACLVLPWWPRISLALHHAELG